MYYRLNVLSLQIPPLRERVEDIMFLTEHFLSGMGRIMQDLDPRIRQHFLHYPWPGNVRQLKNTVERLVYLSNGGRITSEMLPPEILDYFKSAVRPFREVLQQSFDMDLISLALKECNNNYSEAAKKLGFPEPRCTGN